VPAHAQRMSSLLGADKEFAPCGSRKWGVYIMGGEVCVPGGGREGTGRQRRHVHARGLTQGLGAKGTRGAHSEHVAHVSDPGGVEAQRLVEGPRVLPTRREGRRCGGERCEPEGGRAWGAWWRHTRGMHGKGPTQGLGAKGTRGERTWNM